MMGSGASNHSTEKLQEKKALLKTLDGHKGGINCMDVAGDVLLTGSDDRTARLWDLTSCECKVVLEGHKGYVSSCKLWQGGFALTGSFDKTIRKWNISTGNCVLTLERHSGVINRMSLFGSFLFSTSYDSTTVCWDLRNGEASKVFEGHQKSVLPLEYVQRSEHDPGGGSDLEKNKDSIVTGSMDHTARRWSISSATSLHTFRGHTGAILCLAVDRENKMLFTGSTDKTIRKWNLLTGRALKVFKGHDGTVLCLQFHHRMLYSASLDTTARCWVAEFGDTTRKYVGQDHMISDMKYFQGIVFTGAGDGSIRAFDAKAGTLKRTFKGHKYQVNCLIPHNDTMLSGSYDGNVKVWNIKNLIKDRNNGSGSALTSPVRSSVTQRRRHLSNMDSGDSLKHERQTNGGTIQTEGQNNVPFKNGQPHARRARGGRVLPMGETRNGNNNNNSNNHDDLDVSCLKDRLQNMLESEDYWMTSFNQTAVNNLKNITKTQAATKSPLAPSTGSSSRDNPSSESDITSATSRPQTDTSSRPGTRGLTKRESSDLLMKRPRTESSSNSYNSEFRNTSDIALVDEEIRMSAFETLSGSSGYRTADENSPVLPATERQKKSSDDVKSRQKTSVSFSPTISAKGDKNWKSKSVSSRNSKIPTSSRSDAKQTETRNRDKRPKYPSTSSSSPAMTPTERKQLEQEILDMV